MRVVPIECIPEGSLLGRTIYDSNGRILLTSGTVLTNSILNKIREFKILSLYILDEYSNCEIEDIIKPELRQKAIKTLRGTFKDINRLNSVKNLGTTKNDFAKIALIAEEIVENILANKDILVNLVDIKNLDLYTYQHSVNVAVLSLALGVGLRLSKKDLLDLCLGALLHDIGKVFIPKTIIQKPNSLTNEEYELIKTHPRKGYDYLSRYRELHTVCKLIALQHHEHVVGTGYPETLKKDKINYLARIVSIADVYDSLTSDRQYRKALCASDALEYIMAYGGTIFDFDLVKVFIKIIVPFPFGTVVQLSNGDVGIVQDTPVNFPLRPNIKILKSNNTDLNGYSIDLLKNPSLVISGLEYNRL